MNIWDFSKLFALAYLLLIAIYLLFKDNRYNKSNYFLVVFFLVEAASIMNTLLWKYFDYTHIHLPYLFYIDHSIFYLRGASLYLYIQSYTNENYKLRFTHLLNLLPCLVLIVFYYFNFHQFSNVEKSQLLVARRLPTLKSFLIDIVLHLLIVVYLIASLKEIHYYEARLKNVFADIHKIWRNWTYILIGGFLVIMILDIIYLTVYFYTKSRPIPVVNTINVMVFLLTVLIMIKGLNRPEIFSSLPENSSAKYTGSNLKEADRLKIKEKLEQLLHKEKMYHEPTICIKDLAEAIGVLPKHLSQVINEDYKKNFFDLINTLRIEEAKLLLTTYPSDEKNINEIFYETGFNSKTSFNLAFKKYTGHTPTSYRRLFANHAEPAQISLKKTNS